MPKTVGSAEPGEEPIKSPERTNKFDLIYLNHCLKKCLVNVDEDDVSLEWYNNAYDCLCLFFDLFGKVFTFVTSDVKSKVGILREYSTDAAVGKQYISLKSMIDYEVAQKVTDDPNKPSGSRTFLRLHRALIFVIRLMDELPNSDPNEKTVTVGHRCYDDTLGHHHPWMIRKAVHMAMYALPTREGLIEQMGTTRAQTLDYLTRVVAVGNRVYDRSQALYAKHDLLNLP